MTNDMIHKIEIAESPDFGGLLSRSFDLFKKVWLESFKHVLVTMLVVIPFVIVLYAPFVPIIISSVTYTSGNFNTFMDYPVIMIVGYFVLLFVFIIIMQGISIAILSHFFQVCKNEDLGLPKETSSYFAF